MSTTKHRTVPTEHGEVEYDTVECASCGLEVKLEDAYGVLVADDKLTVRDKSFRTEIKIDKDSKYITGHACPDCAEHGMTGYPQGVQSINIFGRSIEISGNGLGIVLWATVWLGLIVGFLGGVILI